MISLNLLSPHKRQLVNQLVHYLFIKELLELILFTAALLGSSYVIGWLILTSYLNDLSASATLVNHDYSAYNQEIVKINDLVKKVNLIGTGFSPITPYILDLSNTLPPDIKITSLSIKRETRTMLISVTAKNRDALLKYQDQLKTVPWISSFDIPASQLLQKDNIDFAITATIDDKVNIDFGDAATSTP